MQLILHLLSQLADPAIHVLVVAILCLISASVFAQTAPNTCPAGQVVTSELVNTGLGCSVISYSSLSGSPSIPAAQVNSDWTAVTGLAQVLNKPSLATVATSGAYSSLTGAPSIPVVQSYENTTQHLNPIWISKTALVAGGAGNVVYNLTADGTSGGTALCPNGIMLNSPNISVNDATAPYQFSWAWTNSNKTLTVLAQKASGLAVLTFTLLGLPAPVANGTSVNSTVLCY